ncbi:MAG TPA: heme-binding protein [Roseiarcus sp.]|jgi:uncharacterized protein GlcG (DUF336 family)|nr:heme-binding protein [Roseiarcus sp.]
MDLLKRAKALTERVEAEATKAKVPVAVCIVDVHGNLVLQHRMNGAPLFSLEISERKAYTSALVRMRTADLLALVQPGQPLYVLPTVAGGRFCPMGGGIPLTEDGEVFAGVGVSGGTAEQDVAIVEAALEERSLEAA